MSRAAIELDFFGLEKQKSAAVSHRRRNYRGIQKTVSQISPELVKSVIAGSSSNSVPTVDRVKAPRSQPIYVPSNYSPVTESIKETPPLTIFFNGTVSVFNVPRDTAESIVKAAMEAAGSSCVVKSSYESEENMNGGGGGGGALSVPLSGDLPLFRRMSLQRFLEKRKARLNCFSPYMCNTSNSNYS